MIIDIDLNSSVPEDCWLPRSSRICFRGGISNGSIILTLMSGPSEFYEYFPFNIYFLIDGVSQVVHEIRGAWETFEVEIPTRASGLHSCVVQIETELGKSPKLSGAGEDERELSVILTAAKSSDANSGYIPVEPPVPSSPIRFDPAGRALQAPRPVFVIGAYRSGTSILTWALGQHPNLIPLEETNWLPTLAMSAEAAFRVAQSAKRASSSIYDLNADQFLAYQAKAIDSMHHAISLDRVIGNYISRLNGSAPDYDHRFQLLRARFSPKQRWVDGTPENTGTAITIARMFPEAKFIFSVRRPDVSIRSLMNFQALSGINYDFDRAAEIWETMNQWACEARDVLGRHRVKTVFSEQFAEPSKPLQEIFKFLAEPQFPQAAETFSKRINSSSMSDDFTEGQQRKMIDLMKIYYQISAETDSKNIEWTRPLNIYEERMNDTVLKIQNAMVGAD